ncbi:MAG: hypothetical protein ACK4GN_03880 [Runella sp.]
MRQSTIYEVKTSYIGSLNALREREPFVVYFSNLKKAIESISTQLAVNGWPVKINYSAVYRSLKAKGKYVCDFDVGGLKVFSLVLTPKTLNPHLSTLGIDEMPILNSKK